MSAPSPPAGPKVVPRVLVVEDTQLAAECLCMVLKELGCTTDHAEDGAEALDEAKADLEISTTHQYKGRERDVVVLSTDFTKTVVSSAEAMERNKPASEGAKLYRKLTDETNVLYVAMTRAKRVLVLNPQLDALLHYVHPPTFVPRRLSAAVVASASRSAMAAASWASSCEPRSATDIKRRTASDAASGTLISKRRKCEGSTSISLPSGTPPLFMAAMRKLGTAVGRTPT